MMNILGFLSDDLKRQLLDEVVKFLSDQAKKIAGEQVADKIRKLSSEAAFYDAFDQAMKAAVERFVAEYTSVDEDLVAAITADPTFWQSEKVRQVLIELIRRPGAWLVEEHEVVAQRFEDVLPERINRERVDKAVAFFLRCVAEELWTLPGAKEVREVYRVQMEKISLETLKQQVALQQAQLQATVQLGNDVREALLQLTSAMEQKALTAPSIPVALPHPRPYHNLPRPDYTRFVGRERELEWLRQRLSPHDRAWQIAITGIGGVGKSAMALAIAHEYCQRYDELPTAERFEAIVWVSAKAETLTIGGREAAAPTGLIFRTLDDIYTAISQTLEREDITRALPEDRDRLAQKALAAQRTLLIVDNLEGVVDERVQPFLRYLPLPTKSILTSRKRVSVADVLELQGLPLDEAEKMIDEEATTRSVALDAVQRGKLFKRTAGLPLSIKLSVTRMASGESFDQVIRWLGNVIGDLPEYCVKGQVDLAHQRDPNVWRLLLACSLFDRDAGAPREALGYVADLSMADRDDGLTLLQQLSLINRTETDRFWMLPIVQGYAEAQLANAEFGETLTQHWLDWLQDFAQTFGVVDLDLHIERTQLLGVEYANLRNAIRWCREHKRWSTLLQLADVTRVYPYVTGLFGEYTEILEDALLASKKSGDRQREGRYTFRLGFIAWVQTQHETALEHFVRAEEIARQRGDEAALVEVWDMRTDILASQGRFAEAEQLAQDALAISERLGNLRLKRMVAYRIATLESRLKHFNKALEWLDRAEAWSRERGSLRSLAWDVYRRGVTLIRKGDAEAAEPFLLQSLKLFASWGERRMIARNKYHLAQVYSATYRPKLARQTAEEARDLFERLGLAVEQAEVEELLRQL